MTDPQPVRYRSECAWGTIRGQKSEEAENVHRQARAAEVRDHDRYLRRQAVQIVAQLPDNPTDAAAVLEYAAKLVGTFIADQPDKPDLQIVSG